jgi:capsular exopolysaccharide synthesis family protein
MTETPRYATLRDYLALLRRQRWVVLAITVAFGGAALGFSLSQTESYEAEASVQFRDISEDARILGDFGASGQNFLQQAAVEAEDVTSLEDAERVKKRLDTRSSPTELQNAVTARVDAQTGFVVIKSSWDDARFAAQVANEFAEVAVDDAIRNVNVQLDGAIERLEREAKGPVASDTGVVDVGKVTAQQQLVALRNLREIAEPAQVAVSAEVPDSPASPKTTRNTVLGAIIGLALGLLAAFVRDSLDRRMRTPKDVHEELGFPVLGRVGLTALGSAGLASNGKTYVAPADLEAFRILRTNMAVLDPERPPSSILVTSGLPEEGKSTVAAALASAAAAAGQRTLLVEADLRRPILATRMDLRPGPGLAEYLSGQAEPGEVLQVLDLPGVNRSGNGGSRTDAAVHQGTLVCITAGAPPAQPAELLASERCRSFVDKVTKAYDLVVFDSSPMLSTADPLQLMPQMASVLLCVRLSRSTHDEVRAVGHAMDLLPDRHVGIVVTGIGASDGYYGDYNYA